MMWALALFWHSWGRTSVAQFRDCFEEEKELPMEDETDSSSS